MKFFDDEVPDKPVYDTTEYKPEKINPFEWSKSITQTKEYLMDQDNEKQYNPFIVNKALSMGKETIIFANEMNSRSHLDRKLQYDFLINIIRASKKFNKYMKPETVDAVEVIEKYYGYSNVKAIQVLPLLSAADIEDLKRKTRKGGLNG